MLLPVGSPQHWVRILVNNKHCHPERSEEGPMHWFEVHRFFGSDYRQDDKRI
jgi:hypothetical protein